MMIIRSNRNFKFLIGISAVLISVIAGLFSVTGISSLFKGAFLSVVFMASVLELGKIVVASYLARYWNDISKIIRVYLIGAVLILMVITSAGIFGYLSDAYQKTKGNYEVVDSEVSILKNKKVSYERQISRDDARILQIEKLSNSATTRADSLNARRLSTYNTDNTIKNYNKEVKELRENIRMSEDSINSIDMRIIISENTNITGELGPLRYIAKVFNTDMDTVVKWFILALIFVFDPLAILLFVSLGNLITQESQESQEHQEVQKLQNIAISDAVDKTLIVQHSEKTDATPDVSAVNVVSSETVKTTNTECVNDTLVNEPTDAIAIDAVQNISVSSNEIESVVQPVDTNIVNLPETPDQIATAENVQVSDSSSICESSDDSVIISKTITKQEVKNDEQLQYPPSPSVAVWGSANFRGAKGVQPPQKNEVKLY